MSVQGERTTANASAKEAVRGFRGAVRVKGYC
jgi:hypothetical protein